MADAKQTQAPVKQDSGFPTPTPVTAPPSGARKPNPAEPAVQQAYEHAKNEMAKEDGKPWLFMDSGSEEAAKTQREQVAKAGRTLKLKVRTRTHKDGARQDRSKWYMLVTDPD